MQQIPVAATPNQSFTCTVGQTRWGLRLFSARGVLCADVDRDGVRILSGVRVVAGEPIIPYKYLETGNFIVLTVGGALPDSAAFGVSQSLYYLNEGDILNAPVMQIGEPPPGPQPLLTDEGFYLTTDDGDVLTDD